MFVLSLISEHNTIWAVYKKLDKITFLYFFLKMIQFHPAPPHVLWQVSFGCWVTWSISSWQKCYKSVFFFNFTKLQFLNNKIYSYTKNNYLALGNLVFWSISSFKTKSKHLSQFFWWEINLRELRGFILQKIWALVAGRQKKKFCQWSLDLGRKKLL